MNSKLGLYMVVSDDGRNKVLVKTTVFIDLVKCALRQVQDKNPDSNMFFSFSDDDVTLQKDNNTFVAKVFLIYSSKSNEMEIGNKVLVEFKDAIKSCMPDISFRIEISGKTI